MKTVYIYITHYITIIDLHMVEKENIVWFLRSRRGQFKLRGLVMALTDLGSVFQVFTPLFKKYKK